MQGVAGLIQTSGGVTSGSGSGTPGASSGATPTQVQVTVNGSVVTGTLPASETIPASGIVCVVSPGIPILNGLTLTPKAHIKVHTPTASSGVQGEVDVDGWDTGLTVNAAGDLSGYLLLVPGNHTITANGPFDIVGGSAFNPTTLTVGKLIFKVSVNDGGVGSIPSALSVSLPINGGNLRRPHFVKVTYPTPDFVAGTGVLTLKWAGTTIAKTVTVIKGKATFEALTNDELVPITGVTSVEYDYVP